MDIVIVRILIEDSFGVRRFNGTAFFIDCDTLITAKHVVENSILNGYKIYLSDIPDGGKLLVSLDDIELCKRDIAIIKVKKTFDISELGFTDKLKVESKVKLIGYHNKDGSINIYDQSISGYTNSEHTYEIQDARTNGLSGSPVILDGRVCGIAQAISSKKNITYIIPISECNIEFIQNRLSDNNLDKKYQNIINISKILDNCKYAHT
jgi:V8-like Glu-specific endopeptidase